MSESLEELVTMEQGEKLLHALKTNIGEKIFKDLEGDKLDAVILSAIKKEEEHGSDPRTGVEKLIGFSIHSLSRAVSERYNDVDYSLVYGFLEKKAIFNKFFVINAFSAKELEEYEKRLIDRDKYT